MREHHKDFFWIYGVLVGLAIREALTQTLHHTFAIPPPDTDWLLHIEIWRSLLFMLMIVRFYVGAVVFFTNVYGASSPQTQNNYYLDFLMGFTQFVLFYAWSVTIFSYSRSAKGFSYFLDVMFIILMFDFLWLIFNSRNDTAETIKVWSIVNTLTALVSFACFLACAKVFDVNVQVAEEIALIPVGLASILGLTENVSGIPVFVKLLQAVIPKQVKPVASAPVPAVEPAGPEGEGRNNNGDL
jgi:hypothetical protein